MDLSHLSSDDVLLLLSLSHYETIEHMEEVLTEKVRDNILTEDKKCELIETLSMIHAEMKVHQHTYIDTVNSAYHESFVQLIEQETNAQKQKLDSIEQQIHNLTA